MASLPVFTMSSLELPFYALSVFFHRSCCQQAVNYCISLRFKNLNFNTRQTLVDIVVKTRMEPSGAVEANFSYFCGFEIVFWDPRLRHSRVISSWQMVDRGGRGGGRRQRRARPIGHRGLPLAPAGRSVATLGSKCRPARLWRGWGWPPVLTGCLSAHWAFLWMQRMENARWTVLPNAGKGVRAPPTPPPLAGLYLSSPLTTVLMFCSPRRWKRWFPRDERRLSAPRAASCPVSAAGSGAGKLGDG